jgi:hypothetical protein
MLMNALIPVRSEMFLLNKDIVPVKATASLTCISPSLFVLITGLWFSNAFLKFASGMFTIWALADKTNKLDKRKSRAILMQYSLGNDDTTS